MAADYCIYFGSKPYFITSQMNERLYALTTWGGTILVNQPNAASIVSTIHDLDRTEAEAVIILTNKVPYYWNLFCEQFSFIEAAGGLVENEHDEYLFILRRGKWDLPKGKLDEGENIRECAVREIQEETGLKSVQLLADLGHTWHTYHEKHQFILKQTTWFKMKCNSNEPLVPQLEEDITEIKWLGKENLDIVLANTYPSVKEIIRRNV